MDAPTSSAPRMNHDTRRRESYYNSFIIYKGIMQDESVYYKEEFGD